jgi:predicted kinase
VSLTVITGPPASGKTYWVKQHAKRNDITIDFDAIVSVLTPATTSHDPPRHIVDVAIQARYAAIKTALYWANHGIDVFIIHAMPSDKQLARYQQANANIITIDPGQDVCIERAHADKRPARSLRIINEWYATPQRTYVQADW